MKARQLNGSGLPPPLTPGGHCGIIVNARRFSEKRGAGVAVERWGKYWVIYYIVFLAVLAYLLRRHWSALDWSDESYLFLLAAIFGVSAGTALTVTILSEFGVSMVLLIPSTYKWIKENGRKEGRQEGLAEGRQEGRAEGLVAGLEEGRAEGLVAGLEEGRAEGLVAGLEEGLEKGHAEGLLQAHRDWAGWNERRAAAERAGLPFDEPPPAIPQSRNGQ